MRDKALRGIYNVAKWILPFLPRKCRKFFPLVCETYICSWSVVLTSSIHYSWKFAIHSRTRISAFALYPATEKANSLRLTFRTICLHFRPVSCPSEIVLSLHSLPLLCGWMRTRASLRKQPFLLVLVATSENRRLFSQAIFSSSSSPRFYGWPHYGNRLCLYRQTLCVRDSV